MFIAYIFHKKLTAVQTLILLPRKQRCHYQYAIKHWFGLIHHSKNLKLKEKEENSGKLSTFDDVWPAYEYLHAADRRLR